MTGTLVLYVNDPGLVPEHFPAWGEVRVLADPVLDFPAHSLWLDEHGLAIVGPGLRKPFRLREAQVTRRLKGRGELLRACGVKKQAPGLRVADLFGGFGIDSAVLALAGCEVHMSEKSPLIRMMAIDLFDRLGIEVDTRHEDARSLLSAAEADVIYLDPMFPEGRSTALPGLTAQMLRELADSGASFDAADWIPDALEHAPRVVLKRRAGDPWHERPDFEIRGRSVRFDVYVRTGR